MKNSSPSYIQFSDEQLMQLFQANGDRGVFSEVYKRYFKVLCKYIHWLTQGALVAEDIAQHILVKLYQKPSLFDTSKNLKVWLFVAAKNQVKNEFRNNTIRSEHHNIIKQSMPHHTSINENLNNSPSIVQVHQLLQHISEEHQEVIILKYINNLTIQEISEVIGSSTGTVKSRIFYGLQKMRSQIPNIKNQET